MSVRTEIVGILEKAKAEIQANMDAKGITASGRTKKSIRTVETSGGFALIGGGSNAAPVPTLEVGREGGKVPAGFYNIIRQWTFDKGLSFDSERERNTFSYFLARKIAREGTARHKQNVDVYSTPVKVAVEDIRQAVKNWSGCLIRDVLRSDARVTNVQLNF